MREEIYVCGYRLYLRPDGLYQDIRGIKFDYTGGRLFQERFPGVWYWLREEPRFEDADTARSTSSVLEF